MADNQQSKTPEQLQKEADLIQERVNFLRSENDLLVENYEIREKRIQLNQKLQSVKEEQLKILTDMGAKNVDILDHLHLIERKSEDVDDHWQEIYDGLDDSEKKIVEQYNTIKKQLEKIKEIKNHTVEQQEIYLNMDNHAKDLYATLTGVSDQWKESGAGFAYHATQMGLATELMESYKKTAKETFTVENILASSLEKVQEATFAVAMAQDQAASSLAKSTQTGDEYTGQMAEVQMTNKEMSITASQASDAIATLYNEYDEFDRLTEQTQTNLATNNAMMDQMGISSDRMAGFMQETNKVLNMTAEESMQLSSEFMAIASSGKPANEIFEDFNAALPQLAQHGDNTIHVFKGMVAASDKLGISMQGLLGIAGQFDTFEGAADSAGKLNALLGGDYLNSVELLAATEEERIGMLIQSMELSGKQWETMGRFEKMAVANAAGIDDMSQAQKLFNQSYSEYNQELNKNQRAMGLTDEQMKEMAKDSASFQDTVQSLTEAFAARLLPTLENIQEVMQYILSLDDALREFTGNWIGLAEVIIGISAAYFVLKGIMAVTHATQSALSIANMMSASTSATDAAAKNGQAAATAAVGKTSKAAAATVAALGVAMLGLGVGIGVAAFGLSSLAENIKDLKENQLNSLIIITSILVAGMIGLSVAVLTLGAAGTAAALPILALGAAFLLMGGGIWLAATGLSNLIEKISLLNSDLVYSLIAMLGTFAALGPLAPLIGIAAGAVGLMAISIGILSASINDLSFDKLHELKNLMDTIKGIKAEHAANVKIVMEEIAVGADKIKSAGVVNSFTEIRKIIQTVIGNNTGGGSQTAAAGVGPIEITLNLDGREMKKFIIDVVNNEARIRGND